MACRYWISTNAISSPYLSQRLLLRWLCIWQSFCLTHPSLRKGSYSCGSQLFLAQCGQNALIQKNGWWWQRLNKHVMEKERVWKYQSVCVWMCACFFVLFATVTRSDQSRRWRQSQRERVRQRSNLCEYLVSLCRKWKKPIYSINHLPLAHICLSQFLSCSPPFYILMLDSYGLLQTRPKFNENSVEQANMLSRSCLAQMSPPA